MRITRRRALVGLAVAPVAVAAIQPPSVPWNVDAEWIDGRLVSHQEIVEGRIHFHSGTHPMRYIGLPVKWDFPT